MYFHGREMAVSDAWSVPAKVDHGAILVGHFAVSSREGSSEDSS
jgi:hypothetical protein